MKGPNRDCVLEKQFCHSALLQPLSVASRMEAIHAWFHRGSSIPALDVERLFTAPGNAKRKTGGDT